MYLKGGSGRVETVYKDHDTIHNIYIIFHPALLHIDIGDKPISLAAFVFISKSLNIDAVKGCTDV